MGQPYVTIKIYDNVSTSALSFFLKKELLKIEEKIKELTLQLLYLTSWKEDDLPVEMRRSWKGYPFDVLNEFTDKDYIRGSYKSKSVYLTEAGIEIGRASCRERVELWASAEQ